MAGRRQNRFFRYAYFKSWPVLALGRCLRRLRVGEAARTPKRHPQSQMALLSTGSTIATSDMGIGYWVRHATHFKKALPRIGPVDTRLKLLKRGGNVEEEREQLKALGHLYPAHDKPLGSVKPREWTRFR